MLIQSQDLLDTSASLEIKSWLLTAPSPGDKSDFTMVSCGV